jgi:triphosphoribosyl-dephospho-CoA synthase
MSIALWIQTACVWEALADKVGNVSRHHDFEDVTVVDFVLSGAAIAPVLAEVRSYGVGRAVCEAVRATRQVCANNTNLGIVLLLAPLARAVDRDQLARLLQECDVAESRWIVQAIREAKPGGLGRMDAQDVRDEPTVPLVELMRLAPPHDRIARQYVTAFAEVFDEVVPDLRERLDHGIEPALQHAQLRQLARHGDSLIARKRGIGESDEARQRAAEVLAQPESWPERRAALDAWLRAEGHARNPGTTADLLAAGLFVLLARGEITPAHPWRDVAKNASALG